MRCLVQKCCETLKDSKGIFLNDSYIWIFLFGRQQQKHEVIYLGNAGEEVSNRISLASLVSQRPNSGFTCIYLHLVDLYANLGFV